MNCDQARKLLGHSPTELTVAERVAVLNHLWACIACLIYFQTYVSKEPLTAEDEKEIDALIDNDCKDPEVREMRGDEPRTKFRQWFESPW